MLCPTSRENTRFILQGGETTKKQAISALSALIVALIVSHECMGAFASYEAYTSWEDWSRLHLGFESCLASSYDRSGGSEDYSYYESPPGLITEDVNAIVKTIEGPGAIYRFWMPHAMARKHFVVRMFFDGEETPRIDTDSTAIMDGTFSYFAAPLITTCAGGQVCYEPITFAHSLRIETRNKKFPPWSHQHYYQYSYHTFPKSTAIDSYNGQLTPQQQQVRSEVVSLFENVGRHPAGNSATAQSISNSDVLTPGGGSLTFDIPGPGLIRKINLRMDDANDVELDGLRLQVFYDGGQTPAIDASVSHFFGAGKGRAAYRSIPLGTDPNDPNDGFYCYWPMPLLQSAQVRLYNTTDEPIFVNLAKIEYEAKAIDRDVCYLHAVENSTTKETGQIYHTLLSTSGRGQYVGDLLFVEQDANSFRMLEGDDVITVDGTRTQNGTGLEDTYNGGAYYNWVGIQTDEPEGARPQSAIRPLNGILYVNKTDILTRADQYRWRIADCISFSRSIEVNVECKYAQTGSRWISVAFWYQLRYPLEDLDNDKKVNMKDYAIFAGWWQESGCGDCGGADLTGDGQVRLDDLRKLAANWLAGVE